MIHSSDGPASTRPITLGLLGPYGAGNLGDAAIQDAAMHQVRAVRPDARFIGISHNPADTRARHGIDAFPLTAAAVGRQVPRRLREMLASPRRGLAFRVLRRVAWVAHRAAGQARFVCDVWRFLPSLDVLVISGGGQIDDYWGGAWAQPFTLALWTTLARLRGRRVIALGIGGWTLKQRLSRVFIRRALRNAEARSFRDTRSRDFVEALGVTGPNEVVPDLAFGYPVGNRPRPATRVGVPVLGICPITAEAWTAPDDPAYTGYLDGLRRLARDRLDLGWEVRLFPSQVRADLPVVDRLADELAASSPDASGRVRRVPVYSVPDFLSAAGAVDVLIAARMHAVLLALLASTPVVAVCYDAKVRVLMERADQGHLAVALADCDTEHLIALVDRLTHRRAESIERVSRKVAEYRAELAALFRELFEASQAPGRAAPMTDGPTIVPNTRPQASSH